jgi:hypothetical protein
MADETDTRPTSAGSRGRPAPDDDDDDDEREEGEIADDSSAPAPALQPATHPLEHSWTFWFDNPQGKSKQAAWGSSIRPIHTFSTVEDFWGYVPLADSSQSLQTPPPPHPLTCRSGARLYFLTMLRYKLILADLAAIPCSPWQIVATQMQT